MVAMAVFFQRQSNEIELDRYNACIQRQEDFASYDSRLPPIIPPVPPPVCPPDPRSD